MFTYGESLGPDLPDSAIPELDFGERMTVTGYSGCNRFSGRATLRGAYFAIENLAAQMRMCSPPENELEQIVLQILGADSVIRIGAERCLTLESARAVLHYRLADWVD
ncbi:MAG: META domain-containing protein [Gammaproteobacteria bacterium]|jgi:heat shock protein HslJ|nr:META domain-containing protein [Gammaproteobacteria bacterium]